MHLASNLKHASQSKNPTDAECIPYDKKKSHLCHFYLISSTLPPLFFPPAAKKEQLEQECWTDGTFHLDYFSH